MAVRETAGGEFPFHFYIWVQRIPLSTRWQLIKFKNNNVSDLCDTNKSFLVKLLSCITSSSSCEGPQYRQADDVQDIITQYRQADDDIQDIITHSILCVAMQSLSP